MKHANTTSHKVMQFNSVNALAIMRYFFNSKRSRPLNLVTFATCRFVSIKATPLDE